MSRDSFCEFILNPICLQSKKQVDFQLGLAVYSLQLQLCKALNAFFRYYILSTTTQFLRIFTLGSHLHHMRGRMKENGHAAVELSSANWWSSASGSETYLQALIENSPIAIVILDANHHYRTCNPAFEQLFQFTHTELLAADLDSLIARPD